MKVEGKVAWVTGASSGIGEALAVRLAERGARVVLSARRIDRLQRVCERCGEGRAAVLPMDVADADSFPQRAREAAALFGRIDLLVNNAGVSQRSVLEQTDPSVIRRLLDLDLLAPILLTRAVLPAMTARGSGHVVLVSSLTGRVATPLRAVYSAAKHALFGFGDALRAEVWRSGVRVTVAAPGFVRTEASLAALRGDGSLHAVMDPALRRGVGPDACAAAIVRAVERDRREVFVALGVRGTLALALKAVAPGLLARIVRTARVT